MEVVSDRLALLVQDETDGVTEWRIDPHVRPVELVDAIPETESTSVLTAN